MNRSRKFKPRTVPNKKSTGFESVPTATICESIMLLITELRNRGLPVYDFDNKTKYIQDIKVFDKIYFLAAEKEE